MSKCGCKKCIHLEVCDKVDFPIFNGGKCDHYINKSLFVELPCKVGEYIGKVKNGKFECDEINGIRIGKETITIYTKKKYYPIKLNEHDIQRIENVKTIIYCDFYCAKTKEEAEKKLKEMG